MVASETPKQEGVWHRPNVADAHTNEVENYVEGGKIPKQEKECGTARALIDTYFVEFMWLEKNKTLVNNMTEP